MTSSGSAESGPKSESNSGGTEDWGFDTPTEPAALVSAAEAEDWATVAEILRADGVMLVAEHLPALRWLFRRIPAEVADADPVVKAGRAMLLTGPLTGAIADGPFPIDRESLEAIGRSDMVNDIVTTGVARLVTMRRGHQFTASLRLTEQIDIVASEAVRAHGEELIKSLPTIRLMLGITRQLAGDLEGSMVDFERSYDGHLRVGISDLARDAAGKAGLSAALMGYTRQAVAWLDREIQLPLPGGWLASAGPVAGNIARVIAADDQLDRPAGELALADLPMVDPGNEYADLLAFAAARHGMLFHSPTETFRQLRDTLDTSKTRLAEPSDGLVDALLLSVEVELHLAAGQPERASRTLARTELSSIYLDVISARLQALVHDPAHAVPHVLRLLAADPRPRHRLELLLSRAIAFRRLRNERATVAALAEALELSDSYQLVSPFAGISRLMLREFADRVVGLEAIIGRLERSAVRDLVPDGLALIDLTAREAIILEELSAGRTVAQIAARQFVSQATVRSQRHTLYRKLDVHSRTEALAVAYERGLL